MSPVSTKSLEGWIDIFYSFIAGRPKIKSTHLICGKTVKQRSVNFFWPSETLVGEHVLLVEILCLFAIRTTIFGPRMHLPNIRFRVKKSWLTNYKVDVESFNTLVWHCIKSCSIEFGNFIRGSGYLGSMIDNVATVGKQWEQISDFLSALPISNVEDTLFTRVGDIFTEVSLSTTQ
jgi:hypothetical protein